MFACAFALIRFTLVCYKESERPFLAHTFNIFLSPPCAISLENNRHKKTMTISRLTKFNILHRADNQTPL